ncbi:hypothetical protein [Streptomyces virginiae]|nr:hypothetical protein [Streptomyces virginiae]MCX4960201.1 hypothetical protein [Streptomyces virginiae]
MGLGEDAERYYGPLPEGLNIPKDLGLKDLGLELGGRGAVGDRDVRSWER